MAKRKKYVRYAEVEAGLNPVATVRKYGYTPVRGYIEYLRAETGLPYSKIAHDLRADSGTDVVDATVRKWGKA